MIKKIHISFHGWLRIGLLILLPAFFIIGWFITADFFNQSAWYLFITLIAIFSTILLGINLRRFVIAGALPVLLILCFFLVGYYFKFYWLAEHLKADNMLRVFLFFTPYINERFLEAVQPDNLLLAFELTTWGYVAFCFAVITSIKMRLLPRSPVTINIPEHSVKRIAGFYLGMATVALAIVTVVSYKFGINIQGSEPPELPFKMVAFITYLSTVPGMLFFLVFAWSDRRHGLKRYWWSSWLAISLVAVITSVVMGSRSALIGIMIQVGTLWVVYRGITRRRMVLLLVFFTITALARPMLTVYRVALKDPAIRSEGLIHVASTALQEYREVAGVIQDSGQEISWTDPFMVIAMRIIGIDSVVYLTKIEPEINIARITRVLIHQEYMDLRFTREVIGFPDDIVQYSSPSMVGAFYWLGGTAGMMIGIFVFVVITQWMWAVAYRSKWWVAPVVFLQLIGWTIQGGSEGTFDTLFINYAVTAIMLLTIEITSHMRMVPHDKDAWRNGRQVGNC